MVCVLLNAKKKINKFNLRITFCLCVFVISQTLPAVSLTDGPAQSDD